MIEIILGHIFYEEEKEIDANGFLPIQSVVEIESEYYPNGVVLGAWKADGIVQYKSHLNAQVEGQYLDTEVLIKVDKKTKETIRAVTIGANSNHTLEQQEYRSYWNAERAIQQFPMHEACSSEGNYVPEEVAKQNPNVNLSTEGEYWYYIPPVKYTQYRTKQRQLKSKRVPMSNHYTTAGVERITIEYVSQKTESMLLETLPSSMDEENFQMLLEDIIEVHETLALDETSRLSSGRKTSYLELEQQVKRLQTILKKLEKNPENSLVPIYQKIPVRKVKHMTGKTLLEQEIYKKHTVKAKQYEESFDLYEHRMLLQYLEQLEHLIQLWEKMELHKLDYAIQACEVTEYDALVEEQEYLDLKKAYDEKKTKEKYPELEQLADTFLIQLKQGERKETTKIGQVQIQIPLEITGEMVCDYNSSEFIFGVKTKLWLEEIRKWGLVQANANDTFFVGGKSYTYGTKRIDELGVKIEADSMESVLFFYAMLWKKAQVGDTITITGFARPRWTMIDEKNEKHSLFCYKKEDYPSYAFVFTDITNVQINGESITREQFISEFRQEDYIQEWKEEVLSSFDQDENMGFYESKMVRRQKKKALEQEKQSLLQDKKWQKLKEEVQKMKQSKLLRGVTKNKERLHSTNLFANHSVYHELYQWLKEKKHWFDSIRLYEENGFPLAKLSVLYEYWCCIKLLSLFIQTYSFTFVCAKTKQNASWESLKQYIREVLKNGELEDTIFQLRSEKLGMEIKLFFNHEVCLEQNVIQERQILPPNRKNKLSHRKPDFILEMKDANGERKVFCMDAKYRSYEKNIHQWYEDVFHVALQKYVIELGMANCKQGKTEKEFDTIAGSFILHSDMSWDKRKITLEHQAFDFCPTAYYGYRPFVLLEEYERLFYDNEEKKAYARQHFSPVAAEWLRDSGTTAETNKEQRIGAVAVVPKNDVYLKNLIRMIMEHHFGQYQNKCWICGEDDLEIRRIPLKKGTFKYHVTCKNCSEFWVNTHCGTPECPYPTRKKLQKHEINYYEIDRKGVERKRKWNVKCPICHSLAPNSEEEIVYVPWI